MAQFNYKARDTEGKETVGVIDASSLDAAVAALQRRNFLITSIEPIGEGGGILAFFSNFGLFESIKQKDIVILSRQLATLFDAKVPVVESFKILVGETENHALKVKLV